MQKRERTMLKKIIRVLARWILPVEMRGDTAELRAERLLIIANPNRFSMACCWACTCR